MIQTKRAGMRPHTVPELEWWIRDYAAGNIPDYQMVAWLMAVCWKGMSPEETAVLTRCMVESGQRLEWTIPDLVDKHSTGGVGDKISLILAPLVASMGVSVPMMAGRGLGHTGGTIDKLETIPGYNVSLSIEDFQKVVETVGCSIVAASQNLCPADRKLYALRDVTATVSCIPLQTSSILCKKIAEHPTSLVLDVKYGDASFQNSLEQAQELAESMIVTAEANGLTPTTCLLTRMDSLIGHAIGNWNEMLESIEMLKTGNASRDLKTLVVVQAAQMLQQTHRYQHESLEDLCEKALAQLESGKAYPYFKRMVQAHGGDISVCDDPTTSPHHNAAQYTQDVLAAKSGYIASMNGMTLGTVAVHLGAGRHVADEAVDPAAGIYVHKKVGDQVEQGEVVMTISTNRAHILKSCMSILENAMEYSEDQVELPPIISYIVNSSNKGGLQEFVLPACLSTTSSLL
jgi:pyrimidine-nucleoside phosphorylase